MRASNIICRCFLSAPPVSSNTCPRPPRSGRAAGSAIAAQSLTWVLAEQVFRIPYGPRPLLWLIGTLAGALIVAALGWLSLRHVLRTPPRLVLQASG